MLSSVSSRRSDVVSTLLVDASEDDPASIAPHLGAYPIALLERLLATGCRIRPLRDDERYRDASPALRRLGADVDAWPSDRRAFSSSRSARCICARAVR